MLIITVSFVILTCVVTSLVDTYSINVKTEMLGKIAYSYAKFASAAYQTGHYDVFSDYVAENDETLREMYSPLSITIVEFTVFITDREGHVIVCYSNDPHFLSSRLQTPDDPTLPPILVLNLKSGNQNSYFSNLDGFFNDRHMAYELPVLDGNDEVIGGVYAVSDDYSFSPILRDTIRTVIISCLWVMLASLVAVYLISERMISPLRAMSDAAKKFAAGKFDARVPVVGNDEVAELAEAFNQMAGSLGELEEMRRSFIANVSHDLRTPMTTIAGFIDGILEGAIPPEKQNYYLGIIAEEVRRLSRLVTTLLDLSKLEAGERKFQMAPFDVCEVARCVLISFEQKIDAKRLDVVFSADEDNMLVYGDKDAIYQVLYNLCDNAIKFSREGGKLEFSAHREDGRTEVSVYNEGIGIDAENLPHIFDRFYKSDKSRGLDKTGVGLGLYICRTIIEAHGGKIAAESTAGEFCRFRFDLPDENKTAD